MAAQLLVCLSAVFNYSMWLYDINHSIVTLWITIIKIEWIGCLVRVSIIFQWWEVWSYHERGCIIVSRAILSIRVLAPNTWTGTAQFFSVFQFNILRFLIKWKLILLTINPVILKCYLQWLLNMKENNHGVMLLCYGPRHHSKLSIH